MSEQTSMFRTGVTDDVPLREGDRATAVVVDAPGLRGVHFALDAGQGLTDHAAPKRAVVNCVAGAIDFTLEGETRTLRPGDLVVMEPGARHALVATEPSRFTLLLLS